MAIELSIEAEAFLNQPTIEPNIILEIEGFDVLFASVKVTKVARIGEFVIGDGTLIGGSSPDDNTVDYIDLSGTTNTISQKLNQDKGGTSSVTSFNIRLIDKNDELSRIFSPDVVVPDVLGNFANVFWMANGAKFPEDAARLISGGIVSDLDFGAGYVNLRIDLAQQLARQEILTKVSTTLTADITDSQTVIFVEDTSQFVPPNNNEILSYIRIKDELIQVTGSTSTGFSQVQRAQLGTIASSASAGDVVESFYRLSGTPIDLALKILLSNPSEDSFASETCNAIGQLDATTNVPNAIGFASPDIQEELGLVVGDSIALISGSGNLFAFTEIIGFGESTSGSYVIVGIDLSDEVDIEGECLFKSQYNTLPFGLGLKNFQVDIEGMLELQTQFSSQFFDYDYYIKDTIDNAKTWIEEKLFFPSGLFGLPRKGRFGVGVQAPPIVGPRIKTISADTAKNAPAIKIKRSINNLFYNSVAFKFNDDSIEDRFLSGTIFVDEDSQNRVKVGNRTLTIEAGGIRDTQENREAINRLSRRFLDLYSLGAETIEVNTNFKTGFSVEVGDTVILDGNSLKLTDINSGSKNFVTRIFSVYNKSQNLKTGDIKLSIADTNLSAARRYGGFSPASIIGSGSTTNRIVLKRSFATTENELERDKYQDYLTQKIRIHSEDYSFDEESNIIGFDNSNPNIVLINPPISIAPSEGYTFSCPEYDDSDSQTMSYWKALHSFWNPQVLPVSGTTTSFDVAPSDVDKFLVGAPLSIHSPDYSQSVESAVDSVVGNTVNLRSEIDFSIDNTFEIDLIGFKDSGAPYAWY